MRVYDGKGTTNGSRKANFRANRRGNGTVLFVEAAMGRASGR
jgi:hypothetical protein